MRSDALVIGSGPTGLVAAIAPARAGRAGFHHDGFSAVQAAAFASPVLAALELARLVLMPAEALAAGGGRGGSR